MVLYGILFMVLYGIWYFFWLWYVVVKRMCFQFVLVYFAKSRDICFSYMILNFVFHTHTHTQSLNGSFRRYDVSMYVFVITSLLPTAHQKGLNGELL